MYPLERWLLTPVAIITPSEGCKLTLGTLITPPAGWLLTIPLMEQLVS